ncbi:hypothetical protein Lal_00048354 [Lupinus albus]|uniref:Putative transcription factor MADS-type1 family n=1 Tax=Lupinus albus TaxID=3870 RepID=A0A6A5M331_LUPAL|nr:putative transcription factor MADS-type1 family [Lupinus albus]KAF1869074.1 hypothetical protein Lal_00048354 [Lupinus albus]
MPMDSSSKGKKRKLEIKEVDHNNKRDLTFSKRKLGLFNKVTELSILCQAETALIISSQQGKLHACGYPNPDVVIRRILNDGSPVQPSGTGKKEHQELVETMNLEYEATHNRLKEEKKSLAEIQEARKGRLDFPPWWNQDIENMGLEDLEHFTASLETLKLNLVATLEAKKLNSQRPMFSNLPLVNECFNGDHQAWNLMNGCSTSRNPMVPNLGFGHY